MTDELQRRLELIEKKTDDCASTVNQCAQSMQQCANDMNLIQKDLSHKNDLTERTLANIQFMVETQQIILSGNPRQDSKDRGLIGDVEQLKSTDARKKKFYWLLVPVFITAMVSSFWNAFTGNGKESHENSEPTKTTVQKTGPGSRAVYGTDRNRGRER